MPPPMFAAMDRFTFHRRAETFGFETESPWSLPALRLLFHVPRLFSTLVDAWEERHPGTRKALDRLVADDWVAYQPGIVIDLPAGQPAEKASRSVSRYVLTASGRRLLAAAENDLLVLHARWKQLASHNAPNVRALLAAFELKGSHARFGMSAAHASLLADLASRTGRWWVKKLTEENLIRALPEKRADVREVIPGHWRIKRELCRQLEQVLAAFVEWKALSVEWPLAKSRFLTDIDPARVGRTGATDYDHDVEAQRLFATLLSSARVTRDARFEVEPRLSIPANTTSVPAVFGSSPGVVLYQPDAVLRALDNSGRSRHVVVEYERFQSRRDAWAHIERFCGWVNATLLPFEKATLCFALDSEARVRSYTELIEAFADWVDEHPQTAPRNQLDLAVASTEALAGASDPLADNAWVRIALNPGSAEHLVLHDPAQSPYNDYFSRSAAHV